MKRFAPINPPPPPQDDGVGALVGTVIFLLAVVLAFNFIAHLLLRHHVSRWHRDEVR